MRQRPGSDERDAHELTAAEEIDMSNINTLAKVLDGASGPLVLNLTAVEYLDSAGLNVLFVHADRLEIVAAPLLAPVLTVSGLADPATIRGLHSEDGPERH
ncbi:hypothetical protein GCM10010358_58620 [Streptomyces minutiscleroticus]|uniref:STAS domain-containing protein n=2 Tax=Streptomyces minutiscleroticus TaxID=68238 RepID=A0A918U5R2_9ACTN|nr:hypothetical protein GCM10010358_58620 [Streptomyces minutiscleroticus]